MKKRKKVVSPVMFSGAKRTLARYEQLMVVKAMLDSVKDLRSEAAVYDVLLRTLKEHKWLSLYLRCVFSPDWKFGLKSKYLKKAKVNNKTGGRVTVTFDMMNLIGRLLMKMQTPQEAVREWNAMLAGLPDDDARIAANRVIDQDFEPITRTMANRAMKECGITPSI